MVITVNRQDDVISQLLTSQLRHYNVNVTSHIPMRARAQSVVGVFQLCLFAANLIDDLENRCSDLNRILPARHDTSLFDQ